MTTASSIYYLRHHEIDKQLWDECIDNAGNGLIYAKSYYLDHIAHHWDAIVLDDYAAVMPLPWKKKFAVKYVYPPPFCQQLGIFSPVVLKADIYRRMLQKAEEAFKFSEYYFNYQNAIGANTPKNNFVLSLNNEYTAIAKNYQPNLLRNLKKAQQYGLHYQSSNDYAKVIHLYKDTYGKRTPHVTLNDYNNLLKICKLLQQKSALIIREVKDETGNLLAVTLCLKDKRRIYLLLPVTTEKGRTTRANHFLLDGIIKEFSAQPYTFDFEGSDIPGIARFYKSFGGINEPYFFYRWNRLPWPIKIFKAPTPKGSFGAII